MLMGRTGFNDAALEDTYIWGLPNLILQKNFVQTTLPKGLDKWKTVVHNLDRLHRRLRELKQSTSRSNTSITLGVSIFKLSVMIDLNGYIIFEVYITI